MLLRIRMKKRWGGYDMGKYKVSCHSDLMYDNRGAAVRIEIASDDEKDFQKGGELLVPVGVARQLAEALLQATTEVEALLRRSGTGGYPCRPLCTFSIDEKKRS